MPYVYRNTRTGHTEQLAERSARLDSLPMWLLIDAPPPPADAVDVPPGPGTITRPAEGANKAAWVAYAVACGMTEDDATALSKASLIQEFGSEDPDGQD
ncbi:hypothetical protein ACWEN6_13565 [Sphaerisporangium sp. NPDC004334]